MVISSGLQRKIDELEPPVREAMIALVEELQKNSATRDDFQELKGVVKELAEAQKRTEIKVEQLVEAQKRTEIKVEQLAEAQKRTEIKMEQLAEAQRKTEEELRNLTKIVGKMQQEIGGLSNIMGYELEDRYFSIFPRVFAEDFGVAVEGPIERKYIVYPDGREDEVNIFAKGVRDSKKVYVIGESKAQLGKKDVDAFARRLDRIGEYLGEEIVGFFLCYQVHPNVEDYLRQEHPEIKLYKSYALTGRKNHSER